MCMNEQMNKQPDNDKQGLETHLRLESLVFFLLPRHNSSTMMGSMEGFNVWAGDTDVSSPTVHFLFIFFILL